MKSALLSWQLWAVLSACFAALIAIFAKIGVENVNLDFATLHPDHRDPVRTWRNPRRHRLAVACSVSARSYWFLVLSGLATGGSWICYFMPSSWARRGSRRPDRQAQRRPGCDLRRHLLGERLSVLNWLGVALIAASALSSRPTNRRRPGAAQSR